MSAKINPVLALEIPPRTAPSVYPEPFARLMTGRVKRQLGNFFGLKKFGVNLTRIEPGGSSALLHSHSRQEEFIYVLEGEATLIYGDEEFILKDGMCVGFPAGGAAHQLLNRSQKPVLYLEVGDRETGDQVIYPKDDLLAEMAPDGKWQFKHKNGDPY